jgi:hypothetical protein
MKYRCYIDEVGNTDLESSDNPNHRFLSLTGVILELDYVKTTVQPQLEALKNRFFHPHPDDPLIFHRKEMVNRRAPFEALLNPVVRDEFDRELLRLLAAWDYVVVSVCLDKKKHKETYQTWRYDPYHYCLAVLLERYIFFLNVANAQGDVLAESRGGKADRRLKDSFEHLWANGSEFVSQQQFQRALTSKQLKVKPKANNIAGLQIADLIAHPSRNEILREQGHLTADAAPFGKRVVELLATKYYQREGKVFGKKFL